MKTTRREFLKTCFACAGALALGIGPELKEIPTPWTLYDADTICGRCGKPIKQEDAEVCWWCIGDLCLDCWEEWGHCGHKGAEEANERARAFDVYYSKDLGKTWVNEEWIEMEEI